MKILATSVLMSVLLVLAGCAAAPQTRAEAGSRFACDGEKMDRIDREARRDNKEVRWLRCPQPVRRAM